MSVHEIRMPQLGETVAEGTVTAWLKEPGDHVAEREPVLEISTDKVDTEIESTVAGVVQRILVAEGETVLVGAPLAEIAVDGERAGDAAADSGSQLTAADLLISPRARRLIDEHGIDLAALARYATSPEVDRQTIEAFLAQLPGKTRHDGDLPESSPSNTGETFVPFTRVRKLTAERMTASVATSPHVTTAVEVDFEGVAQARAEHRDRLAEQGVRLTWLPFMAWAVTQSLPEFERLNASVRGNNEGLVLHPAVHLGIAVDLDGEGLVVPVIRDAEQLRLVDLAQAAAEMADKARTGSLRPDDTAEGTFTLTGQGPHRTLFTTPIINQPQVAILSLDGVAKRPVVAEQSDEIVAHHTGIVALSWDHRAVDGVYAGRFLDVVRDRIEHTGWQL